MDTMTPVYSSGTLLIIAAVAVAVLLVLIIALRMHAFVALVLVSFGTAVAAGVPVAEVPTIAIAAFGSTLGTVALLVGLGVMIGRLLEVTGGAQVLADTLVNRFGEKRAPLALGVAALLFGLPIFFDAGLVVFLPIIFSVAKRFGGSVLMYALPAAGAFAAMHAIVPPHPGPVTAATEIDASIGLTLLIGVVVAVVAWFVGVYAVTLAWLGKVYVPIDDSVLTGGREADTDNPPAFWHVLGILLLPLVLIGANTVLTTLRANGTIAEEGAWVDVLVFVGQTPVALLIALLVATYTLAVRRYSAGRDRVAPQRLPRPDLRDHPDHRRRRHVRRRAPLQRYRCRAVGLARRPRPAAHRERVRHRHHPARRAGLGDGRADHHGRPHLRGCRRGRPDEPPARGAGAVHRGGGHRPVPRQRLRLLAGRPVLRDGREDHPEDLDRHGDHARRQHLRALPRPLGPRMTTPGGSPLHLVFMGVSGSGKSTVAPAVQERLGWEFAEGDDFHPPENVAKMSEGIPLKDADRWGWLESLAEWTSERDARGEPTLIACSALRKAYRDVLRRGGEGTFFVHCTGDKHMLLERMSARDHFMPPSLLESQLDTLEPLAAGRATGWTSTPRCRSTASPRWCSPGSASPDRPVRSGDPSRPQHRVGISISSPVCGCACVRGRARTPRPRSRRAAPGAATRR